jgi:hypothetical protein
MPLIPYGQSMQDNFSPCCSSFADPKKAGNSMKGPEETVALIRCCGFRKKEHTGKRNAICTWSTTECGSRRGGAYNAASPVNTETTSFSCEGHDVVVMSVCIQQNVRDRHNVYPFAHTHRLSRDLQTIKMPGGECLSALHRNHWCCKGPCTEGLPASPLPRHL